MTRWILTLIFLTALAVAPAAAQTSTPAKPSPQTQKPATAKPTAPTTAEPAAPTATPAAPATPAATAAKYGPGVYAHITTNHGAMIARLFSQEVPRTVENFVGLAEGKKQWRNPRTKTMVRRPYYNNLTFHRIMAGFMIQGGDPEGTGIGGPGFTFADEFHPKLRHSKAGILSMANAGPNTNGGQFFITVVPTPHLDNRHSVFGELVEGTETLMAIAKVPTNGKAGSPAYMPLKPVIIKSIRIERVS